MTRLLFRKLVFGALGASQRGSLTIGLPGGGTQSFGGLNKQFRASIDIRDENFFRRCVMFGAIGFAESYIAGEWDTPDLTAVISWFILNSDDSATMRTREGGRRGGLNFFDIWNRLQHLRRPNSVKTSRRNIGDHYDLSNEFFRLWLDPTMTYSSGYFDPPDISLEEAQRKKYERLCTKLQLTEDDEVLEIGSGWGGFSLHAAKNHGCRVTTLTISKEQFEEAGTRIEAAGMQNRIELLLCDYRDLQGRKFDKIASIEMLEAVGDKYVDGYFAQCDELLKPEGLLGIQAILCPDRQFPVLRDGVDFIQKHIFPGSLLMSMARITEALNRSGNLNLLDYNDMAPHYANTLRIWWENFSAKRQEVLELGFDERFLRKWRYYLNYCEAAFAMRHITVAQMIFSRPNNLRIDPVFHRGLVTNS